MASLTRRPRVAVTGPSRGIGRAAVQALVARGAEPILMGRPSPELAQLEGWVREQGRDYGRISVDLSDTDATVEAARALLATHGPPDAIVHNAATITRAPVEEVDTESFDRQLAVNLRAPFLITRELLPAMRAAKKGRLVFVASIAATLGTAGASAYGASKWGLVGFVKCLAEELKDSGLSAMALLPGSVDTSMLVGSGFVPRMTPEEVAKTITYYCLDAPLGHNGGVVEMFGV